MNWQTQDNKHQRGKIDRVFVSQTAYYERHHFIDHYLKSNSFEISEKNRGIVADAMDTYPGKAPILRDALTTYLNEKFKK